MPPGAGQVECGWGQGPDAVVARPPGGGVSSKHFVNQGI